METAAASAPVEEPVAGLALAGLLTDGPPAYSSGWTPYVLLVRPDLSTLYLSLIHI